MPSPEIWPNISSTDACTEAHMPAIIMAMTRGAVSLRWRVNAVGMMRLSSISAGLNRARENSDSSDGGSSV